MKKEQTRTDMDQQGEPAQAGATDFAGRSTEVILREASSN